MAPPSLATPHALLQSAEALNDSTELLESGLRNARPTPVVSQTQALRTVFERFELKFWVTEPQARRVLDFALPYLKRDAHAVTRDAQRNTTLYLDTRGFRFCEDHLNLSPDRVKLRVRAYGRPLGPQAFLEIKRKVKVITMKERVALPMVDVENVLSRRPVAADISEAARRTLGDFVFQMCLHRAVPKLFVACHREAFESRITGEDVRLTIDRELVYQPAIGFRFTPNERRWLDIREGDDARTAFGQRRAMLELKFNGTPPRWMVELVRHFRLQREAFSKYTAAAQQLRGRT